VYGPSDSAKQRFQRLYDAGAKVGINFLPGSKLYVLPTLNYHRIVEYGYHNGKGDELVEILFKKYFEEGRKLNQIDELANAAEQVGLSGADATKFLLQRDDVDKLKMLELEGHRKALSGIFNSCFINIFRCSSFCI